MPMDNIIVLDHFFNLTKKLNLISRQHNFWLFGSGLLFWATLCIMNTRQFKRKRAVEKVAEYEVIIMLIV